MEKIIVELGNGDCPCCHKNVGSKKMVFVESDVMCLDYAICIKCYDKIHLKVMKALNLNTEKHHCAQCENRKVDNPWCNNCKEKDCEVELEGTCAMVRKYLSQTAEVERLKGDLNKIITEFDVSVKTENRYCYGELLTQLRELIEVTK